MKTPFIRTVIFIALFSFLIFESSFAGALVYSTYLGGSNYDDVGKGIAADSYGNAYITGWTSSADFRVTPGAYDTSFQGYDVFVTKVDSTGTTLVYSTFLGGGYYDFGWAIAIDSSGSAYITGYTQSSTDFPTTPGAFNTSYNGGVKYGDIFVSKLNPSGSALVYSTYLGGAKDDFGTSIVVDSLGNVYLTGFTYSSNYPTTPGAIDTSIAGIFVSKLNTNGTALVYSTFLRTGTGYGIRLDNSGNAYITGETVSSNFPTTPDAFDTTHNGGTDAFLTKINTLGTALVYSTYLGGGSYDSGRSIAIDGSGNAYIAGITTSADFPTTPGTIDSLYNNAIDIIVSKLFIGLPLSVNEWLRYEE